jgi:Flp pilus assembly protein TadG
LTRILFTGRYGAFVKTLARRTRLDAFRAEDGATAVEFALVAAPFFALIVAILDLILFFFAESELETATEQVARLVLTGQISSSATQAQFQQQVCSFLPAMFTCSAVMVDLQTDPSWSSATPSVPTLTYNAQGQVTNSWQYQIGAPGSIETLRVMYQWPVFPGPLNLNFANLANGCVFMMSTAVFRNEPT